jgi:hypothetical protein
MPFFDEQGNQIQCLQWLKLYEPYYFLNGPRWGQHINGRNQTSPFVEDQVCALLEQTNQLSRHDLILAMAWKIGLIDHRGSEVAKDIQYMQNWSTALRDRYGRDFSGGISSLATRMPAILQQIAQGKPQYLFDLHPMLGGFGPVYVLTVLFFATHGKYPIYDQYAHVAAQAVHHGLRPESYVNYKGVQLWSDYKDYMNLLSPIGKACPPQSGPSSMFISRPLDRALWVYGHLFRTKLGTASTTQACRTRSSAPIMTDSSGVLVGRIRDLCQFAGDGWRRREILLRQDAHGCPRERDCVILVDSSGALYGGLPFIRGAGVQGYVCLGKPGVLKPWFTQRYPVGEVRAENVYFEPTGRPNEYRIYSESEWKSRRD